MTLYHCAHVVNCKCWVWVPRRTNTRLNITTNWYTHIHTMTWHTHTHRPAHLRSFFCPTRHVACQQGYTHALTHSQRHIHIPPPTLPCHAHTHTYNFGLNVHVYECLCLETEGQIQGTRALYQGPGAYGIAQLSLQEVRASSAIYVCACLSCIWGYGVATTSWLLKS